MCGTRAYDKFQEYAAVFPQIVDILRASGVEAKVESTKDKTGFLVEATFPAAVLSEESGDNWSVDLDGELIDLGIPVENRDARAIAVALLKAIGK
jgi:hypothetical protein